MLSFGLGLVNSYICSAPTGTQAAVIISDYLSKFSFFISYALRMEHSKSLKGALHCEQLNLSIEHSESYSFSLTYLLVLVCQCLNVLMSTAAESQPGC